MHEKFVYLFSGALSNNLNKKCAIPLQAQTAHWPVLPVLLVLLTQAAGNSCASSHFKNNGAASHTKNKYSHAIYTYSGQPLAEFFFTNLQVHSLKVNSFFVFRSFCFHFSLFLSLKIIFQTCVQIIAIKSMFCPASKHPLCC